MPPPLISIIEDDEDIRVALMHLVRSMGMRAAVHASADAFLLSDNLGAADCIVTDISMPGLDGIELKHALDVRGIDAPVIMITGRSDHGTLDRARASNPYRLLFKPFASADLAEVIHGALKGS